MRGEGQEEVGRGPLPTTAHPRERLEGTQECSLDQREGVAEVWLRERDGRTKLVSKLTIWQALQETSCL